MGFSTWYTQDVINIVDAGTGAEINPLLEVKAASPDALGSMISVDIDAMTLLSWCCIDFPEFNRPVKLIAASVSYGRASDIGLEEVGPMWWKVGLVLSERAKRRRGRSRGCEHQDEQQPQSQSLGGGAHGQTRFEDSPGVGRWTAGGVGVRIYFSKLVSKYFRFSFVKIL